MVMKKISCLIFVFTLLLAGQTVLAVPQGDTILQSSLPDVTFTMNGGTGQVDCAVYQFTNGSYSSEYLYTYQIENINTGVGLSFFSIAVTSGAVINDTGWDSGTANPLFWTPVTDADTSLVQSVEALFNFPIKNTQTSALLWFVSDNISGLGQGFLFGRSANTAQDATANLLSPVPEPATISLLVFGGILAALARRKNNV